MKKSTKHAVKEEEVAEKAEVSQDELSDIQSFIQKRRLHNKILKKLTDELQSTITHELNKPKSA